MARGFQSSKCVIRLFLALVVATSPALLTAQEAPNPKRAARSKTPSSPGTPDAKKAPTPPSKPGGSLPAQRVDRKLGQVSIPVTAGVRLLVANRTTGRIAIRGWDREIIEARAVSDRGEEVVIVGESEKDGRRLLLLKADYKNLENIAAPTQSLDAPPLDKEGPVEVHLEVNVPRSTELELIRVKRSTIEIEGIETAISVITEKSDIALKGVGPLEAHTQNGSITIEKARGMADITSKTGTIKVRNSQGAVRAVSITGAIEVRCFKGRVDVGNTQGPIELVGIEGDVEAIAASSDVRFAGPLNGDGRYYLKSMSGRVEMMVAADTSGFNAVLTSYRGKVESDFLLSPKPRAQNPEAAGHRLSGRFRNGGPQVTLDSFEGLVKLSRMVSTPVCQ